MDEDAALDKDAAAASNSPGPSASLTVEQPETTQQPTPCPRCGETHAQRHLCAFFEDVCAVVHQARPQCTCPREPAEAEAKVAPHVHWWPHELCGAPLFNPHYRATCPHRCPRNKGHKDDRKHRLNLCHFPCECIVCPVSGARCTKFCYEQCGDLPPEVLAQMRKKHAGHEKKMAAAEKRKRGRQTKRRANTQ